MECIRFRKKLDPPLETKLLPGTNQVEGLSAGVDIRTESRPVSAQLLVQWPQAVPWDEEQIL
jgi:hypothetical protein